MWNPKDAHKLLQILYCKWSQVYSWIRSTLEGHRAQFPFLTQNRTSTELLCADHELRLGPDRLEADKGSCPCSAQELLKFCPLWGEICWFPPAGEGQLSSPGFNPSDISCKQLPFIYFLLFFSFFISLIRTNSVSFSFLSIFFLLWRESIFAVSWWSPSYSYFIYINITQDLVTSLKWCWLNMGLNRIKNDSSLCEGFRRLSKREKVEQLNP